MTINRSPALRYAVAILLAVIGLATSVAGAAETEKKPHPKKEPRRLGNFRKLTDQHINAVVTVKFVMKLKAGGQMQELDTEAPGLMIRPDGLVLCANTQLGGGQMLKQLGMAGEPTEIKVLVGDDEDEYDAKVLARDTDLDLAWIQIENEDHVTFNALDFTTRATPKLGQKLYAIRRMTKFYDRAPIVETGRLYCITTKPRKLYVPGGDLTGSVGAPVFDADGTPVGLIVVQMPPDLNIRQAALISQLMSSTAVRDDMTGKILPAEKILKATERALKLAKTQKKPTTQPTTTQAAK